MKVNLEEKFMEYLTSVYPDHKRMPNTQRVEVRKSFYAGMLEMLNVLTEEVSKLEEEEGLEVMEDMQKQMAEFIVEIIKTERNEP